MPLPSRVHAQAVTRAPKRARTPVAATCAMLVVSLVAAQAPPAPSDEALAIASAGRTVRLGPASGAGPSAVLALETYVARVLAGEAEPRAPEAAMHALAIAIRTYALANAGRHAADGFDLCDGTHCQVPRAETPATRAAALATAGQFLAWNGAAAEVFYSASCGGYSESAADVWPGADYPYLRSAPDQVHDDDAPWTYEASLADVQRALAGAGFAGRLTAVEIGARNQSGRVSRVRLRGMRPDVIAGDRFRAALGPTRVRSTAFAVERRGTALRFVGRGYGHGVGMCVIGAGRRAAQGETLAAILQQYYPGLALDALERAPDRPAVLRADAGAPEPALAVVEADLGPTVARLHAELVSVLGGSPVPPAIRVHESIDSFRQSTGRPWWVASVSEGPRIDLLPAALLAQGDGLESALRVAIVDVLVADALRGRPLWVRVGAARHFGRGGASSPAPASLRCPADAELTLAISAAAYREAESRAEACFAREVARTGDWRAVR